MSFLNRSSSSIMHLIVQTGCVRSLWKWIRPCVTLVKATYTKATIYQVRPCNNLLELFFSEVQGELTFTCLAHVSGQIKILTLIIAQWKKSSKMLALLATNRILFRLIPNSLALVHPVSNFSIFYISRSNSPAPMQTLNFSFIWASQLKSCSKGQGPICAKWQLKWFALSSALFRVILVGVKISFISVTPGFFSIKSFSTFVLRFNAPNRIISSVPRFLVSEQIILWTDFTAFLFKESLVNIYFLISGAGLFRTLTILLGECKLRNIEETTFPVVPDLGINVKSVQVAVKN